jgi:DNA helicase-2/ATP-dependent DNA helicase PcrA
MPTYDVTKPWNIGVRGTAVLPLINDDAKIMRVEAGPGTGKTFGLVRRLVRILHPNGLAVRGDRVAVVAFNRVIAKELRKEVEKALSDYPHEGSPVIQTVHGFCLRVVGEDIRMLLPHEREAMLYDVLEEYPKLRSGYRTHQIAEQALHDHEARHKKHLRLWAGVQSWLIRHKARLISDLPGLLLDRIRGGDFTNCRFEHVIVDEFQDLTPAEQELFLRLRSGVGQFVGLGDPRQSIYAFLGNDRHGLANLDQHQALAGLEIHDVSMAECQRCPKEIVIAANKLMSLTEESPLEPVNETPTRFLVTHWKTPESEAKGMAKLISGNIRAFPSDKHLAMVTRRRFGYRLRDEIANLDSSINIELGFSESILELWPAREAFLFFSLLADPDAPTWRAWLGYRQPLPNRNQLAPKRNASAYLRFLKRCNDVVTAQAVLDLCDEKRTINRGEGGTALRDQACRYRQLIQELDWGTLDARSLIDAVFEPIRWVVQGADEADTATTDLQVLRTNALQIFDELGTSVVESGRDRQLREVARQLRYTIATREPLAANLDAQLQVMTLWGGKGLTADHVYVVGLCDEAIPGVKATEYPGTDLEYVEEQRRLFYVSMTRAKKTLVLSRPKKIRPGDAKRLNLRLSGRVGHYAELQMCRFLREIMDSIPDAVPGETL